MADSKNEGTTPLWAVLFNQILWAGAALVDLVYIVPDMVSWVSLKP